MMAVPKKRDAERTRARILAAASDAFAEQGFGLAGTRDIAKRADVTLSLISRYFGTKAALYEQVLSEELNNYSTGGIDRHEFGRAIVAMLVDKSDRAIILTAVLSLADPEARAITQRVTQAQILTPLAEWIGTPDADIRAMNILTLLNGSALQLLSGDGVMPRGMSEWLAKAIQDIVDG